MRKADRLFQIIQILRGARRARTAGQLADELEVGIRTVYRDIADLIARRVPIRGEAGVGYVLDASYDMPPLMLTPDEIEAAVLGAQWVAAHGDPALAQGAKHLIAKIAQVVPSHLRPIAADESLLYPNARRRSKDAIDMGQVRSSIRKWRKIRVEYQNERGEITKRLVWPLAVAYFDSVRLIAAWCETRQAFRHFRTDRVRSAEFCTERIPVSRRALIKKWEDSEGGRSG